MWTGVALCPAEGYECTPYTVPNMPTESHRGASSVCCPRRMAPPGHPSGPPPNNAGNGDTATRSRGEQARKWNVEQRDPVLPVERMTDLCVFPVAHLNVGMWDFQTWQGS